MKKTFSYLFPVFFILSISLFLLFALLQQNVHAATLTVTKTADTNDGSCNADCSLREAVSAANNNDTINFANNLSGMSISLASSISINKAITIDGSTVPQRVTLQMSGSDTILETSSVVTLDSLIFRDGLTTGAIRNTGNLTIDNTHFENNRGVTGGAITNEGNLTVTNSTFVNNQADDFGGAIYNKIAITSNSPLDTLVKISDSTFEQNSSKQGGAIMNDFDIEYTPPTGPEGITPQGFIIPSSYGYVEIHNSTIANNTALINGGGILNYVAQEETPLAAQLLSPAGVGFPTYGIVYIEGSEVISNTAVSFGGGIHNTIITPTLTVPIETPSGTPTYAGYPAVIINQSTVGHNSADYGGGIANTTFTYCAPLDSPQAISALPTDNILIGLYDSLIANNQADVYGGGLYLGDESISVTGCVPPPPAGANLPDVAISGSTFVNNSANIAGGIHNGNGRIVIGNSTFSANIGEQGAAIVNYSETELWHTTVYTNTVGTAVAADTPTAINGVGSGSIYNNNDLTLVNSIIAATNGPAVEDCLSVSGSVNGNNNIILDGTSCLNGITIDPNLQPLAKIIGHTPTHGIEKDSSAVDAADILGCDHYLVGNRDQRGLERPLSDGDKGGQCDIGSYEYVDIGFVYLPIILKQ